jgi:transposase
MYKKTPEKVKAEIINKIRNEGMSVPQASEVFSISTTAIYSWLNEGITPASVSILTHNKLKRENAELYEIIGRLTLEKNKEGKKRGG